MHPQVIRLEERSPLKNMAGEFMSMPEGLDRLADMSGEPLNKLRAEYWRRVSEFGIEPKDKVFIDKEPLNTINLPLIAKLFPTAKVLFAVRDPRDVVFSCYRRHFDIDHSKFEFLTLETCAAYYAAVMNLGERCRAKLPLTVYEHRYEDMIADFDKQVRAVCDFLGIKWTDSMRAFSETAGDDAIHATVSAAQVRRPLYQEGVGQWRRYAGGCAPSCRHGALAAQIRLSVTAIPSAKGYTISQSMLIPPFSRHQSAVPVFSNRRQAPPTSCRSACAPVRQPL